MAKGLKWSRRAQNDRAAIFEYWNNRNRSAAYSQKLNVLFLDALHIVMEHPESGLPTEENGLRSVIVRDYRIYYESSRDLIEVLTIFDTNQDPTKLEERLK
jgi:addiction module RelE/StbE family toxin